jgi:hypothetical protein
LRLKRYWCVASLFENYERHQELEPPRVGAIVVGGDWLARDVYRCSSPYLNLKVINWYYYKYLVWFMWSDCKVKKGIMSRM